MKNILFFVFIALFAAGVGLSFLMGFEPGREIGRNLVSFLIEMVRIFPPAFILIGLFEVWVKRETVERHLGGESGARGFIWVILLAMATIGPFAVSLPVGYSLYRKGARPSVVLAYLGAAGVCRVPMTLFEASYLGIKFTAVRWSVSLGLIILTSLWLGRLVERRGWLPPRTEGD